jgi:hypothetical protein
MRSMREQRQGIYTNLLQFDSNRGGIGESRQNLRRTESAENTSPVRRAFKMLVACRPCRPHGRAVPMACPPHGLPAHPHGLPPRRSEKELPGFFVCLATGSDCRSRSRRIPAARIHTVSSIRCSSGRRVASAQVVIVCSPQKNDVDRGFGWAGGWPSVASIVYLTGGGENWRKIVYNLCVMKQAFLDIERAFHVRRCPNTVST